MAFARPETLHETFTSALRAQDVEALLDLYEPNALTVLPDGTQVAGSDARRGLLTGLTTAGPDLRATQSTVVIAEDLALTSTTYEVPGEDADGPPTTVQTAEVSRRQPDGTWRVVIDAPTFA